MAPGPVSRAAALEMRHKPERTRPGHHEPRHAEKRNLLESGHRKDEKRREGARRREHTERERTEESVAAFVRRAGCPAETGDEVIGRVVDDHADQRRAEDECHDVNGAEDGEHDGKAGRKRGRDHEKRKHRGAERTKHRPVEEKKDAERDAADKGHLETRLRRAIGRMKKRAAPGERQPAFFPRIAPALNGTGDIVLNVEPVDRTFDCSRHYLRASCRRRGSTWKHTVEQTVGEKKRVLRHEPAKAHAGRSVPLAQRLLRNCIAVPGFERFAVRLAEKRGTVREKPSPERFAFFIHGVESFGGGERFGSSMRAVCRSAAAPFDGEDHAVGSGIAGPAHCIGENGVMRVGGQERKNIGVDRPRKAREGKTQRGQNAENDKQCRPAESVMARRRPPER